MIISFELTMPNRGSWNGKWTGEDKKHYLTKKISNRYLKSKDHFKNLLENKKDDWYYSWNDGWGANVRAEIVDTKEAARRRKVSLGFCGYEWMIDSIIFYGSIMTRDQIKDYLQSTQTVK